MTNFSNLTDAEKEAINSVNYQDHSTREADLDADHVDLLAVNEMISDYSNGISLVCVHGALVGVIVDSDDGPWYAPVSVN